MLATNALATCPLILPAGKLVKLPPLPTNVPLIVPVTDNELLIVTLVLVPYVTLPAPKSGPILIFVFLVFYLSFLFILF